MYYLDRQRKSELTFKMTNRSQGWVTLKTQRTEWGKAAFGIAAPITWNNFQSKTTLSSLVFLKSEAELLQENNVFK